MKTTTLIIIFTLLFVHNDMKAQLGIELQAGGSNFLGASFNAAYDFKINQNGLHYLTTTVGFGAMLPAWTNAPNDNRLTTLLYHAGLNYRYQRFGVGVESSFLVNNPFLIEKTFTGGADLIVYPNLNYLVVDRSNWYLKLSGGAYFAFDKIDFPEPPKFSYSFAGDVIPGIGISAGIKLNGK